MPIKLKATSGGSVSLTPADTASDLTITVPAATGTMLVGSTGASTTNTVTNKIAVVIGGTTYYLLASTSAA